MKIEKIETWLVSKWLTVRVTCDDGTYGVGEGNFWSYADATELIAHRIGDDIKVKILVISTASGTLLTASFRSEVLR